MDKTFGIMVKHSHKKQKRNFQKRNRRNFPFLMTMVKPKRCELSDWQVMIHAVTRF